MRITTITKHSENNDKLEDPRKSPDWEFMHQCALIDKNPPVSWNKFADSASLVKALYADLMNNPNDPKNVYGLSVALLRHWREISKS